MRDATEAAVDLIKKWAQIEAPRLAEAHTHRFDEKIAGDSLKEIEALEKARSTLMNRLAVIAKYTELHQVVATGETTERKASGPVRFQDRENSQVKGDLAAQVIFQGECIGYRVAVKRNWQHADAHLVPERLLSHIEAS